ncbi:hypothetical protein KHA80_14185 [Anaerobacillus sp. HL2]|nr:hypothetical protein KHA80_14185 [Anaerobacillus sp. HL2]
MLNAQYCLEALKMFKDSKCEKATMFYYNRMSPITVENADSDLVALISPVREACVMIEITD